MSVLNREIAERLRTIRELSDMTVAELSEKLKISPDDYTKYESGNDDIPVSLLYDVSNILKVSMTELLTGDSAKLHTYSLVRNGRGVIVDRDVGRNDYKYQDLAYSFAGRRIEPLLVTVPPSKESEPYHLNSHTGHEYHYCLEGSFKIKIDKYELTIYEGDSLYFDSGYPHGMKALNEKEAKLLVIVI